VIEGQNLLDLKEAVKGRIFDDQVNAGLSNTDALYYCYTSNRKRLALKCYETHMKRSSCEFMFNWNIVGNTAELKSFEADHTCVHDAIPEGSTDVRGRKRAVSMGVIRKANFVVDTFTSTHGARQAPAMLRASSLANPTHAQVSHSQAKSYAQFQNRPLQTEAQCIAEYGKLPSFFLALQDHDPKGTYILGFAHHGYNGTKAEESDLLKHSRTEGYAVAFSYYYICPSANNAASERWRTTRRIAAFDGAHLSSCFGGTLYEFRGYDANNSEYTIAWGVSSARENKLHATAMMDHFLKEFESSLRQIVSDNGSSFIKARAVLNAKAKHAAAAAARASTVVENPESTPFDVPHKPVWVLCSYHMGRSSICGTEHSAVKDVALATSEAECKKKLSVLQPLTSSLCTEYLKSHVDDFVFYRLQTLYGLQSNFNVTSSNAAEHANSVLRNMRESPLLTGIVRHFEADEAANKRVQLEHNALLEKGVSVSPKVTQKCIAMHYTLSEAGWILQPPVEESAEVTSAQGYRSLVCQARHRVRTGYAFTVIFSLSKHYEKRIVCTCTHTQRAGMPCEHAAFFLVNLQTVLDKQWQDVHWYHPVYEIRPIIGRLPALPVQLEEYESYRVLPPSIPARAHGKRRKKRRSTPVEDVATETTQPSMAVATEPDVAMRRCDDCNKLHKANEICVLYDHQYICHATKNLSTYMSVLRAPVMTKDVMKRLTVGKHLESTEGANMDSADGTQYSVSNANDEDFDIGASNSNFRFAAGDGPAMSSRESAVSSDCDDDTQAQLRNTDEADVRFDDEEEEE